jgi:hypothetical protein
VHTTAPNSMIPWLKVPGVSGSTAADANFQQTLFICVDPRVITLCLKQQMRAHMNCFTYRIRQGLQSGQNSDDITINGCVRLLICQRQYSSCSVRTNARKADQIIILVWDDCGILGSDFDSNLAPHTIKIKPSHSLCLAACPPSVDFAPVYNTPVPTTWSLLRPLSPLLGLTHPETFSSKLSSTGSP